MDLRIKLIAAFLVIALVPMGVVGFTSLDSIQQHSDDAQRQSESALTAQTHNELNQSVQAHVREVENQMDARRIDVQSLAESPAVQNYQAASAGEMELVQELSQSQLGYASLQMRDGLEAITDSILESDYDGREWEDLSEAEQQEVADRVEKRIAGKVGTGLDPSGAMYEQFKPGYFGQGGYFYIVNTDMETLVHPAVEYKFNVVDDAGLTVFEEIRTDIRTTPAIENGTDWGVAEYDWEDTTQEGNPVERKFIAYTYYDRFDWILAPNVYYYELQETAVEDARKNSQESFESYLETRKITVDDAELRLYDEIVLTDADGTSVARSYVTDTGDVTSDAEEQSYATTDWFRAAKNASAGEVTYGDVKTTDEGQHMNISMPVYYDGSFNGVVTVRFNYSTITALTETTTIGDSGSLSIVDQDGQFVSHPSDDVIRDGETLDSLGMANISDSVRAGDTGLGTTETGADDDDAQFVAYSPFTVGDQRYTLLASVPEQEVRAPVNALAADLQTQYVDTRNILLGLIGLSSVVVVAIGFLGARRISRPIEQVRDRATALSEGQIEEWDEISARNDEIGEMVSAFESMRHELEVVAAQANALADQRFDDPAFDEQVSGELGDALTTMHEDTQAFAEELERAEQAARAEAEALADALEQKALEFSEVMERAADGDLTQRLRPDSDSEAMQEIAVAYNEMMDDLEETIDDIQTFAQEVAVASEEASAGAREVKQASEDVSESVQEIASGAHDQREKLDQVSNEMTQLSATIEEAASSARNVAETSQETADVAQDGEVTAQRAIEEMEAIQARMETTVGNVGELDDLVAEIGDIVDLISEIAEQTNLLALNANIEAARAGANEDGSDGFAVVADEVKQLAEETQESAEDVGKLVDEVQSQTTETVEEIEAVEQRVRETTESVDEAVEAFTTVVENVAETDDGVQEISDAVDDQATSAEQAVSMVDDVAEISQATADESESVSAAAEEQASSMTQTETNVSALADQADKLQDRLEKFETAAENSDETMAEGDASTATAPDGGTQE